jgi:very-short-patch-repair endonuclease
MKVIFDVKILRFSNNEVFTNLNGVIEEIFKCIADIKPPLGGKGVNDKE